MRNPIRAAALLVLLLAAPPVLAQGDRTPEPPQPPDSGVTERVEVRLVEMAILARDRKDRPITDLTADELVVKDQGRKMKVASLDPFRKPQPEGPVPDVRLYLSAPGAWDEVSRSQEEQPSYVIVFIDVENDQRLQKQMAIDQVVRFLREQLDPSYRAAVFSYDGEIHQEVLFTSDRDALANAVRRAYDRPPRPQVDIHARMRGLIRNLEECVISEGAFIRRGDDGCIEGFALDYTDERRPVAEEYLNALEGMVRFAAGLRGRKTVLSLSHGASLNPATEAIEAARAVFGTTEQLATLQLTIDFSENVRIQMDRLMELALEGRVTLHFVDRNLAPSSDISARQGSYFQPGAAPLQTAFEAPQWDMEEMATHTGGIFLASPDLYAGLKKAMDIERGGYFLGYYVDHVQSPQRLAKVKISTTRRGVKISHRRGYFEEGAKQTFAGRIALGLPVPLEDEGREGQFVPFTIRADPYMLGYEVLRDAAEAHLTLHFLVQDENGRSLAESFHFLNHAYPREVWDAKQAEPVTVHGWLEAPAGQYRLFAYLRNSKTGRDGELTEDLVVVGDPRPAADLPADGGSP